MPTTNRSIEPASNAFWVDEGPPNTEADHRDDAPVDAALVGAGEQRVLAIERGRADRALDHVGIDLDPAIVEKESKERNGNATGEVRPRSTEAPSKVT
jgi:hypothetical protein